MYTLQSIAGYLHDYDKCRNLLECWLQWRGDDLLPLRQNIHPEDLRAGLSALSLIELEAPDRAIFRVHGSDISSLSGKNLKGRNLLDFATPRDRSVRMARYQKVSKTPCGMLSYNTLNLRDGGRLDLVALFLPVTHATDRDPKFLYLCNQPVKEKSWPQDQDVVEMPLANELFFIDIGCGVPDID